MYYVVSLTVGLVVGLIIYTGIKWVKFQRYLEELMTDDDRRGVADEQGRDSVLLHPARHLRAVSRNDTGCEA